jgi:hypothetical protein|mmetsp:Transcript_21844/g.53663  ORF Transcript_21844/g.53663 Transcript_21844/m.53663 type:complete len:213 (+) Transcript_21844:296-934(+)
MFLGGEGRRRSVRRATSCEGGAASGLRSSPPEDAREHRLKHYHVAVWPARELHWNWRTQRAHVMRRMCGAGCVDEHRTIAATCVPVPSHAGVPAGFSPPCSPPGSCLRGHALAPCTIWGVYAACVTSCVSQCGSEPRVSAARGVWSTRRTRHTWSPIIRTVRATWLLHVCLISLKQSRNGGSGRPRTHWEISLTHTPLESRDTNTSVLDLPV